MYSLQLVLTAVIKVPKSRKHKLPPAILAPSDPRLQLKEYMADEDVIERCGKHIYLFTDINSNELVSSKKFTLSMTH